MSELKDIELARSTFNTLCKSLDNNNWKYKPDVEDMSVFFCARGEDLPIDINIKVDAERKLVWLASKMPYNILEDKRVEIAVAVSVINNSLIDGNFDYDIKTGNLYFTMTNSFIESRLSENVFSYMFFCACQTIDEYNDKLLMLSKGVISLEEFISDNTNE